MFRAMRAARGRVALGVAGLGLLAGCADVVGAHRQPAPAEEALPPGIHPVLVVKEEAAGSATLELHLRRVQVAGRIAAFQGELRYDVAQLDLSAARLPAGIPGAWNEVEKGRLRFAGAATDGIPGEVVLVLSFATRGEVAPAQFEVVLEELVASEGFRDLTPAAGARTVRPRINRS